MTFFYRFKVHGTQLDIAAPGQLQKVDGTGYLVVAKMTYAQALALQEHVSEQRPMTIWVEHGDTLVAFMQSLSARMVGKGQFVQLAAAVHLESPFAKALRT